MNKKSHFDPSFISERPADFEYSVEHYSRGHSTLCVRVTDNKTDRRFYLFWAAVEYFSGNLNWKGGKFAIAKREECLNLLRHHYKFEDIDEELIFGMHPYQLFEIGDEFEKVRILAGHIYRQETL